MPSARDNWLYGVNMTFAQKIDLLSNEQKIDFIRFLMHKDRTTQMKMNIMTVICVACVGLSIFK